MGHDATETCRGTRADGNPCQSTLTNDEGFCPAHREGGREEMRRRGEKGGKITAEKFSRPGLDPNNLPRLETPEDAETWLEAVARGRLEGRIDNSTVRALTQALRDWLKAHAAGSHDRRMKRYAEALEAYEETGDPEPVLTVIE